VAAAEDFYIAARLPGYEGHLWVTTTTKYVNSPP
jgi:hypothetical protein